ncbi:MAG: hypothetical protein ABW019_11805 [Chitinophagaceae bacterium]
MTTTTTRIALYIGNDLYPTNNVVPQATIDTLQDSPLTSPILSLLNHDSSNDTLVYNDGTNPMFNSSGNFIGPTAWAATISVLRNNAIREIYMSFSTNGTDWLAGLLQTNHGAAMDILVYLKNTLGLDGIDLDYESDTSSGSNMYPVAKAAVAAGLKLTAAPYFSPGDWQAWVEYVQGLGGTVSWLNLQCYAGGKSNNPGAWNFIGVPIVAGSCTSCGSPQTTCSPSDMQALFTLWRTGTGSVSQQCWWGTPNTGPQAIGGGFIWAYSSIAGSQFLPYMNALKTGLGMFTVQANQAWLNTGLTITQGQTLSIFYQNGLWTADPQTNGGNLYDAAGCPGIIVTQPGYTLIGANMGALCGFIGSQPAGNGSSPAFLIGDGYTAPAPVSGVLWLCIDDDLEGLYGAGLTDNTGSVTVTINIT